MTHSWSGGFYTTAAPQTVAIPTNISKLQADGSKGQVSCAGGEYINTVLTHNSDTSTDSTHATP